MIKAAATDVKNLRSYDSSVLARVLNTSAEQCCAVASCAFLARDIELTAAVGAAVRVSTRMRFGYVTFDKGDLLFVGGTAILVEACASVDGDWALVFRALQLIDRRTATTSLWKPTEELQIVMLSRGLVRHAACWYTDTDRNIVALGM